MAKGKSRGDKYVSKGIHSNVRSGTLTAMKRTVSGADRMLNLKRAWAKGLNPWLTIANPDKSQTNRLNIRVRANEHWGDPKRVAFIVPSLKVFSEKKEAA